MTPESLPPASTEARISTAQRDAWRKRDDAYALFWGQLQAVKSDPIQVEAFSDWVDEQVAEAAYDADKLTLEAKQRKPNRADGVVQVVFTHAQNLVDRELANARKTVRTTKKLKDATSEKIRRNPSGDYHLAIHEFHDQYGIKPKSEHEEQDKGILLPLHIEVVKLWVEPNAKLSGNLDTKTQRGIEVLARLQMVNRLTAMREGLRNPQRQSH